MKGSCLCCGIPLDRATRYVAIADVILGASSFIFLFVQLKRAYDGTGDCCKVSYFLPRRYEYTGRNNPLSIHKETIVPPWLPIVILVCTAIQSVMGVVLYAAVSQKNRNMCRIWMFVTGATCLFTGFLLRIYQVLVVSEFSHELEDEKNQTIIANSCRIITHPISPQQMPFQQLQVPAQAPATGPQFTGIYRGYAQTFQQNQCQTNSTHSSVYAPPTPPSLVPIKEEELPPPPYHIAVGCPVPKYN